MCGLGVLGVVKIQIHAPLPYIYFALYFCLRMPSRYILPKRVQCIHCSALKWPVETPAFCCCKGELVLPSLEPTPDKLKDLIREHDFRTLIRLYNSIMSFTSVGGTVPDTFAGQGNHVFEMEGALFHRIGSLLPENREPAFSQLYVWDTEQEINNRISRLDEYNYHLDPNIVLQLQEMLHEVNPYVQKLGCS